MGNNGQHGWVHDDTGKANVFYPNARAIIYVGPATEARGDLVYDIDRSYIDVVRAALLCNDANAALLPVALSDLYAPMGSHGKPDKAEYTKRLHAILMPDVDSSSLMVTNDPVSGDASFLFDHEPVLSADGDIPEQTRRRPQLGLRLRLRERGA